MPVTRAALLSAGRSVALAVPVVELVLVLSGLLDLRTALLAGVVLEVLLAVVVVGEVAVFRRAYRRARANGLARTAAAEAGTRAAFPPSVIALA